MLRKATIKDAKSIYSLIAAWAKKGKVLHRPLNYIYENIRDYWIYSQGKKIAGVCALHVVGWEDFGEIKSLVVEPRYRHKGIGSQLIGACLFEAETLRIKKVFTLTFISGFFKKFGFKKISMKKLPHKIWTDCIECVYFPDCKEVALIKKLAKKRHNQ